MLRKAIVVQILLLLALGVADARTPEVGDHVYIATNYNTNGFFDCEGDITYIGDGLICLSCTNGRAALNTVTCPFDMCIGTGSIVQLIWI
jgi:hypothetical protein